MRGTITTLAFLTAAVTATYTIEDDYASSSFASMFDFFTYDDPTHGYVNYIDQASAESSGLYKIQNGAVYMGVDSTNTASGRGRDSIRISSKKSYNHGLIILDLAHMPAGACGTWPAFWLVGPNWPYSGEVDIIEGVGGQTANNMAVHTDAGCTITNTGAFSGHLETSDCDVNAANQGNNVGCSIRSGDSSSFGAGFNSQGGGVYATEWNSDEVSIWFFPRGAIPSDITSGNPDPTGWGLPQGQFTGGCDIDDKIKNQQIVFDVTFCGDWAGGVWSQDTTCAPQASTCQAFVQNNPGAFKDTYWLVNSLKVYTDNGNAAPAPVPTRTQPAGTSSASIPYSSVVNSFVTVTNTAAPGVPVVPGTSYDATTDVTVTVSRVIPAPGSMVATVTTAIAQPPAATNAPPATETAAPASGGWGGGNGGSRGTGGWGGRGGGGGAGTWGGRGSGRWRRWFQ
jgi:uncharacterized membrane protein YgcG